MQRNGQALIIQISILSLVVVPADAARARHLSLLTVGPVAAATVGYLPLSWENTNKPHPERAAWSLKLSEQIDKHYAKFNSARDVVYFCPGYALMGKPDRIKTIGDLFAGIAYHESGFNPLLYSIDVGEPDSPSTWSVGLFQMSVVDQASYGLKLGYTFTPSQHPNSLQLSALPPNDLRQPLPNIVLATEVMAKMLDKHNGVIRVSENPYWATLKPGGKYDKSSEIRDWVLRHNSLCSQKTMIENSNASHKEFLIYAKNWRIADKSDLRIEPKSDTDLYFENLRGVGDESPLKFVNQSFSTTLSITPGTHQLQGSVRYDGNFRRLYLEVETFDASGKRLENHIKVLPSNERPYKGKIIFPFELKQAFAKATLTLHLEAYGKSWGNLEDLKIIHK